MPLNDSAAKIATDPLLSAIPHIDQLFGAWAIYEPAMEALRTQIELLDLANHLNSPMAIAARERASAPVNLEINSDGIALIRIVGSMQKQESSFGGASTVSIRRQLNAAANSDQVRGIMLWGETPGGTVAGTAELGDTIVAAGKKKPLHAYGEDLVASAGYWALSQASRFSVNRMGQIGSIGTFSVVHDYSRQADARGVKVHVVRAGAFKGVGTPGTEITAEQLAMLQGHIDKVNEHFLQAVATGRGMKLEDVRSLADGRVHIGEEAKRLGLVDAVSTFDEAMAALVKSLPNRSLRMSTENNNPPARVAATINEIKAGCPGATNDFIVDQLGRSATLAEAQSAWMTEQSKANQVLQEKLKAEEKRASEAEEKAKAAEAKGAAKKGKGVDPIRATSGGDDERDGDPVAEFNSQVASMCGKNPTFEKRQRAIRTVANRDPELYQDYLLATNSGKKAQRLILEKLEDAS